MDFFDTRNVLTLK